jgi:hypothetical protein
MDRDGPAVLTAKTDSNRSRSVLWHDGHDGVSSERDNCSNCRPQPLQEYSKRGMSLSFPGFPEYW